eukprot:2693786-Pyramimonas_sp.AAC.2
MLLEIGAREVGESQTKGIRCDSARPKGERPLPSKTAAEEQHCRRARCPLKNPSHSKDHRAGLGRSRAAGKRG